MGLCLLVCRDRKGVEGEDAPNRLGITYRVVPRREETSLVGVKTGFERREAKRLRSVI